MEDDGVSILSNKSSERASPTPFSPFSEYVLFCEPPQLIVDYEKTFKFMFGENWNTLPPAELRRLVMRARQRPKGRIELIEGPMFSGKTTELIRRRRCAQFGHVECLVVKPLMDTRNDDLRVSTHSKDSIDAMTCELLMNLREKVLTNYDAVFIDEGQFFPDLVEFCSNMATCGIRVVVAALNGTFEQHAFPVIAQLVPHCDQVDLLMAQCVRCGDPAPFSFRKDVTNREMNDIGGADKYEARCRACLRK